MIIVTTTIMVILIVMVMMMMMMVMMMMMMKGVLSAAQPAPPLRVTVNSSVPQPALQPILAQIIIMLVIVIMIMIRMILYNIGIGNCDDAGDYDHDDDCLFPHRHHDYLEQHYCFKESLVCWRKD